VVSLPEAGRTGESVLGLSVYLTAKAQRDKSRLSKRCMLESAVEQGIRRARSLSVKLNCLNSNLDEVKCAPIGKALETDVTLCLGMNRGLGQSLSVNGGQRGPSRDEWRR
jgi:hypothetical protein